MKCLPCILLASALTSCAQQPHNPERLIRNSVLFGATQFDEEDWAPVEDQVHFGFNASNVSRDSGYGHEVGMALTLDDELGFGDGVDASVLDFTGGLRVEPETSGALRPYFGVGLSIARANYNTLLGPGVEDVSFGGYVRGGLAVSLTDATELVFDVRYRTGTPYEENGFELDSDALLLSVGIAH